VRYGQDGSYRSDGDVIAPRTASPAPPGALRLPTGHTRRRLLARGALALVGPAGVTLPGPPVGAAPAGPTPPPAAMLWGDPDVERDVEGYRQRFPLSCEYGALHTALRLLGLDVAEDVMRDLLGSGEDPDVTFRGRIDANQNLVDYGVHARGVLRLLGLLRDQGGLPASLGGTLLYDLDAVRLAVAGGQPAVVWIPLDLRPSGRVAVTLSTGRVVDLVPAEHAVTVRGYDGDRLFALDPHWGTTPTYDAAPFAAGMALFDDPALAVSLSPAAGADATAGDPTRS
jgi:hypothetical protein